MAKPLPKYLELTAENVTITLTKPVELNGVKQDKITLRAPTVRDIRNSTKTSDGDDEQRELNLFASLAEVHVKELEGLAYKDYNRVAAGYTFLVRDDEL
ncbi:Phage tail assembly chaperone protein, E, or 41 or 14 [Pseudomonas sp. URIL14HWK12:I8]|uniref:phage tail assembly protein n=1 Tax=unclassified Pseudomonas TaxID=196821 RepID=UPI0004029165|nr:MULTISPECIES: phage tail assembly protein [unclassified Pseudomonas]SNB63695.1 Phage tail assembly chaperone protein, E, or 41 or 14 [Pseudomonas sp. URIL14HWK12:I8]